MTRQIQPDIYFKGRGKGCRVIDAKLEYRHIDDGIAIAEALNRNRRNEENYPLRKELVEILFCDMRQYLREQKNKGVVNLSPEDAKRLQRIMPVMNKTSHRPFSINLPLIGEVIGETEEIPAPLARVCASLDQLWNNITWA